MARTVGDTQLPTNVPPVNVPNGRAVCPLSYRDAQLPSPSLPHRQADMVEVVRLRSLVRILRGFNTAWTFSATNVRCHAPDAQLPSPSLPHAFQG